MEAAQAAWRSSSIVGEDLNTRRSQAACLTVRPVLGRWPKCSNVHARQPAQRRSRPSRGCGPHRPDVGLMDVRMRVIADGSRPLPTVMADLPAGRNRMPPGRRAINRSGSPAATPTAISSASPATGTVAHRTELVCLHPAGLPELRLRHPANTTVTPALRTGKPDWAASQKCDQHRPRQRQSPALHCNHLHNHKDRARSG